MDPLTPTRADLVAAAERRNGGDSSHPTVAVARCSSERESGVVQELAGLFLGASTWGSHVTDHQLTFTEEESESSVTNDHQLSFSEEESESNEEGDEDDAAIPRRRLGSRGSYAAIRRRCRGCRRWWQSSAGGKSGVLSVVLSFVIALYALFLATSPYIVVVLTEVSDAADYLKLNIVVQVVVASICGLLLLFTVKTVSQVTCSEHTTLRHIKEAAARRRASAWGAVRAFQWIKEARGPSSPIYAHVTLTKEIVETVLQIFNVAGYADRGYSPAALYLYFAVIALNASVWYVRVIVIRVGRERAHACVRAREHILFVSRSSLLRARIIHLPACAYASPPRLPSITQVDVHPAAYRPCRAWYSCDERTRLCLLRPVSCGISDDKWCAGHHVWWV